MAMDMNRCWRLTNQETKWRDVFRNYVGYGEMAVLFLAWMRQWNCLVSGGSQCSYPPHLCFFTQPIKNSKDQ